MTTMTTMRDIYQREGGGTIAFACTDLMAEAVVTHPEGSDPLRVFVSLPGGYPWGTFDASGRQRFGLVDAPQCATFAEFRDFIIGRFGVAMPSRTFGDH